MAADYGFAEGKPGQHILDARRAGTAGGQQHHRHRCEKAVQPHLVDEPDDASVAVADPATGTDRLAVVLIPADS